MSRVLERERERDQMKDAWTLNTLWIYNEISAAR